MTIAPEISVVPAVGARIWRVGRAPDPWAWIDHQYAGGQRWDDHGQVFRTIYAADSAYSCYVEILAFLRPDRPSWQDLLADISEDPEDADEFPVPPAGVVDPDWIRAKMRSSARLIGAFADVRAASTIAALRPLFLDTARRLGLADFDAAAVKSAHPRELTQKLASHLYALVDEDGTPLVDGVRFASRHGDELGMWAIFERPGDEPSSRRITDHESHLVDLDDPDLRDAMQLHGLTWPTGL
ncbi:hypothetical protein [Microbacterium xylanilyticum]